MSSQLALFTASSEADLFHDPNRGGFFSILVQGETRKYQSSHKLSDMHRVLGLVNPTRDTWISQAEFMAPNRRVVNLARIGLLFADLDTYRLPWALGRSPEALAQSALYLCLEEGVPPPSILVFSGRGLQAKWLLNRPVPRQALPRWNACQRHLIDRLKVIGADVAAKDASRVLRLVETVNSRSGEICRVVHLESGEDGHPLRYDFEDLAEALLPVARITLEEQRKARKLKVLNGGKKSNLRAFSGRQLAWDRLEDLRRLAVMRGGVKEGERMTHLFWQINFMLLSGVTNSFQMFHEARALARQIAPGWVGHRTQELSTLYLKAKQFEAGERVEFLGKKLPPLYTPRNQTLIDLFHITDDEQKVMRTLICKDIALSRRRERDRERHMRLDREAARKRAETRRRAAGAIDRATYEANALSNSRPWESKSMSRASWYRAVKALEDGGNA